jgi:hypothetical protein
MNGPIDFAETNRAALAAFPAVLERVLPDGKRVGAEVVALNPGRADRRLGSFKVNRYNGRWPDFATGDKGGDPISLVAYLADVSEGEAARLLARMLGIETGGRVMDDRLNLSPFSDDEREAAAQEVAAEGEPDVAKPTCPPADAEPRETAAARLFGRAPSTLWRYADAVGALVFCVCRWNFGEGKKEIRPLSWFDGEGWRFGHCQATRPLYNLDRIAAEPNAPIVLCEGEKAADAAARVFPKSIATTSSGGAKAANKTYWVPLAGRRVLIWPDNDEPGAKYAREVAVMLAELDCDLSIIDAAGFAAQPNAREPEGWDAADALADWPDLAALRKAAAGVAKPFDPGPAYLSFPPYTMDAGGLSMEKTRGKMDTETETLWIAAPFEVLGECRDPEGGDWGSDIKKAIADTLLALTDHLPAEASEALLELATGGKPRASLPVVVAGNPFDHPDAQRRFRVMANVEELDRALDFPWEKWIVFLHPEQQQLVELDYAGPARVSGSVGTGNTIVALHRAAHLARVNPDTRVLLTTFSDTLADALQTKAALPLPPDTVLAYRANDAANVAGLSRSSLYVLIGRGKLRSVLVAGRRLIPADALRDLLRGAA